MNPKDINLEALLEIAKDNLNIVEYFSSDSISCNLNGVEYFSSDSISCNLNGECKLKPVLNDALNSFKLKLSEYTLADII